MCGTMVDCCHLVGNAVLDQDGAIGVRFEDVEDVVFICVGRQDVA